MDTIQELKQAALKQEQVLQAKELANQAIAREAEQKRANALYQMLQTTAPLSSLLQSSTDCPFSSKTDTDVTVTFQMPGYADIVARFQWESRYDGVSVEWAQVGFNKEWHGGSGYRYFEPSPERMWAVRKFAEIYQDEDGEHIAFCDDVYFANLGEALLAAERAYVPRSVILERIFEANRSAALEKELGPYPGTAAHSRAEPLAPEPTSADILTDALREFIKECVTHLRHRAGDPTDAETGADDLLQTYARAKERHHIFTERTRGEDHT